MPFALLLTSLALFHPVSDSPHRSPELDLPSQDVAGELSEWTSQGGSHRHTGVLEASLVFCLLVAYS